MKKLIIPIHSFIDVITNSSTESFVAISTSAVRVVKDLISEILIASGSDKKVDDLFNIDILTEESYDGASYNTGISIKLKSEGLDAINIADRLNDLFYITEIYD